MSTNIQAKANLIWEVATKLVGVYKPHEYGKVILPMTVLKRFDDILKPTKEAVLKKYEEVKNFEVKEMFLTEASGYSFYNTSKYDFEKLLSDPDNIESNFKNYLSGFSDNVQDILSNFKFENEVKTMADNRLLYVVIEEFNTKKAYMGLDEVKTEDMGYIFEELVRKFSESYDEEAGAHFTARDIIYLMTDLLVAEERDILINDNKVKTIYDMAMGTSQMLACMTDRLHQLNKNVKVDCYGQELNPETYAIAKADMLIKGGDADNFKQGDTLSEDQFKGYTFDYIISNPPFGIDWKKQKNAVESEAEKGYDGRFGPGLPPIGDGQLLFLLNGVKKLKDDGKMAIIQGSSSLDNGEPESGISNIRKYLIESDYVEAIVKLPMDLFYNTPISTCIWIITKNKSEYRKGKIQLIDAQNCFIKRRKNIGDKKVNLTNECISLIVKAYGENKNKEYDNNELFVESKIFPNHAFQYYKVKIETPLTDENGNIAYKKNKMEIDKNKSETEIIYANTENECQEYFDKELKKFNPNSWIDFKKTKKGYGIPFTKLFYHETDMIQFKDNEEELLNIINENHKKLISLVQSTPENNNKKMKESQVSWIGEVPFDWEIHKVKNHYYKQKEVVGKKVDEFERLALTLKGVIKRSKDDADGLQPSDFEGYQILRKDDLVFKMIDLQNISTSRVGLSPYDGIVSPAYIRLTSKSGIPQYAYYYFLSMYYNNIFNKSGSDGIRSSISADDMLNFAIPVPSKQEQVKISNYLEKKTAQVDELIEKQENLINELKEYKKALIYEVTSGKRIPKDKE